jgi:hypothetical protein
LPWARADDAAVINKTTEKRRFFLFIKKCFLSGVKGGYPFAPDE